MYRFGMNLRDRKMRVVRIFSFALVLASTASAFGLQSTTIKRLGHGSLLDPAKERSPCLKVSKISKFRPSTYLLSSIETNDQVKDPSTLISAQDDQTQQQTFVLICGGILGGSLVFLAMYNFLEAVLPSAVFGPFYTVLPCVLSLAFISAGIAHFVLEDTFTSFVPPKGSWGGLWQVPSPGAETLGLTYEQYHSFWSGVAEILVGTSLLVTTASANGLLPFGDGTLGATTLPAELMWMITACVTPANIYMYTHNPVVPRIPALPYPWGHGARLTLQCALLAVFAKLTLHSLGP